MASIVETKAVALRRGNHNENLAFTGVQGEVVVDLGNPDAGELGTDANATLRLHNGITRGGIPMARADMLNVSTSLLTRERHEVGEKNLACADLSNIEEATNPTEREKIKRTLVDYGLADKSQVDTQLETKVNVSTNNLNTAQLVSSAIHNGVDGNKPLAYADTSNINTVDLVDSTKHTGTSGNKPLAYADTSNVNTSDLVSSTIHDGTSGNKPLSYNDLANVDTTNLTLDQSNRPSEMSGPVLAASDLSNVSSTVVKNMMDNSTIERNTNKDSTINEEAILNNHYPETDAVVTYVKNKINEITDDYVNTSLTNVTDWNILYDSSNSSVNMRTAEIINSGNGFELNEPYATGIYLTDDEKDYLWVQVDSVDSSGSIQSMSIIENIGSMDLSSENPFVITSETNVDATFTITSTDNGDGTYTYSLDSITNGGSGFNIEDSSHDGGYTVKSSVTGNLYKVMYHQLTITPMSVDTNGAILVANCEPQFGFTVVNNNSVTITSPLNSTATLSISTSTFNENGGAGLTKTDLTNLKGMTDADVNNEINSPWRIRHNEAFPSTSDSTIPASQDYTIATNGAIWRELKQEYYTKAEIDALIQQISNS